MVWESPVYDLQNSGLFIPGALDAYIQVVDRVGILRVCDRGGTDCGLRDGGNGHFPRVLFRLEVTKTVVGTPYEIMKNTPSGFSTRTHSLSILATFPVDPSPHKIESMVPLSTMQSNDSSGKSKWQAFITCRCGNSRMTEDMYEDGFTSIANIDISKVVVEQMKERHKDKATLTWQVMNKSEWPCPCVALSFAPPRPW
eukprot:CAMPEP_0184531960 /NCGR_PEP_ID=MMETSP0198_2-20121128/13874_1 /TAXON_ID=1112570 /ORGANISM="Thraustochytrium sp., Strain LLF1b" /LENGTH=197 /DNA_ID=CAMNT_0026924449 /DNA_START=354 /DNA_END=945 /DNA_ORIENTATION=-